MNTSPERQSDFAKRVLFGVVANGGGGGSSKEKQDGVTVAATTAGGNGGGSVTGGGNRSGSQSSVSSAPSGAIYSIPATPKNTANGKDGVICLFLARFFCTLCCCFTLTKFAVRCLVVFFLKTFSLSYV